MSARPDFAAAEDIEADFDAAGMEAWRPIQFGAGAGFEVVPFNTATGLAELAAEGLPALADGMPGALFGKRGAI